MSDFTLEALERIIAERGRSGAADSWTAKLMAGGMERAAKKMGVYHWLVVLAVAGIPLSQVLDELSRRTSRSGVEEKASRSGQ